MVVGEYARWRDVLETEDPTNLKILQGFRIIEFDLPDTATDVFSAANYCSVRPVHDLLKFFMARFEHLLYVHILRVQRLLLVHWRLELIRLLKLCEYATRLQALLIIVILIIRILLFIMVEIKGNGQAVAVNVITIIFMYISKHTYRSQRIVHLPPQFAHDIFNHLRAGINAQYLSNTLNKCYHWVWLYVLPGVLPHPL